MNRLEFNINLSAQEYLLYYRGSVNKVVARCTDGTTIQFPALLKPFVTSGGIVAILPCHVTAAGRVLRSGVHSVASAQVDFSYRR
jgi:hypothetical protein